MRLFLRNYVEPCWDALISRIFVCVGLFSCSFLSFVPTIVNVLMILFNYLSATTHTQKFVLHVQLQSLLNYMRIVKA